MVEGHRIERKIKVNSFIEMMKHYSIENLQCTIHTFIRLSDKQRKIFKCDNVKEYLLSEIPILVGIQHNKCYAIFYKYKNQRFIRIIADISLSKINIVTFYIIENDQLPNLK